MQVDVPSLGRSQLAPADKRAGHAFRDVRIALRTGVGEGPRRIRMNQGEAGCSLGWTERLKAAAALVWCIRVCAFGSGRLLELENDRSVDGFVAPAALAPDVIAELRGIAKGEELWPATRATSPVTVAEYFMC